MEDVQLKEKILSFVPDAEFEETVGYLNVYISSEKLHDLA